MSSLIDLVRQSLKWKQSAKNCAERIGIDVEDYLVLKNQLIEGYADPFVEGIVSVRENLTLTQNSWKQLLPLNQKLQRRLLLY